LCFGTQEYVKLRFTWLNLWYSGYIFAHLETEFLALPRSQTEFVNEVVIICSLNLVRFTPMRLGGAAAGEGGISPGRK
ncbi:MAG: hypothetical protein D6681_22090, partial [Calditrichaeota bacterium]